MKFQFESLQAFMHMEGHGVFVWACYGAFSVVMVLLVLMPVMARKKFAEQVQSKVKRQQAQQSEGADYAPGS